VRRERILFPLVLRRVVLGVERSSSPAMSPELINPVVRDFLTRLRTEERYFSSRNRGSVLNFKPSLFKYWIIDFSTYRFALAASVIVCSSTNISKESSSSVTLSSSSSSYYLELVF
jgi:hypothetical protein